MRSEILPTKATLVKPFAGGVRHTVIQCNQLPTTLCYLPESIKYAAKLYFFAIPFPNQSLFKTEPFFSPAIK